MVSFNVGDSILAKTVFTLYKEENIRPAMRKKLLSNMQSNEAEILMDLLKAAYEDGDWKKVMDHAARIRMLDRGKESVIRQMEQSARSHLDTFRHYSDAAFKIIDNVPVNSPMDNGKLSRLKEMIKGARKQYALNPKVEILQARLAFEEILPIFSNPGNPKMRAELDKALDIIDSMEPQQAAGVRRRLVTVLTVMMNRLTNDNRYWQAVKYGRFAVRADPKRPELKTNLTAVVISGVRDYILVFIGLILTASLVFIRKVTRHVRHRKSIEKGKRQLADKHEKLALKSFEIAIRYAGTSKEKMVTRLELADYALKHGEYDVAAPLAAAGLKADPQNRKVIRILALSHSMAGHDDENALDIYRTFLKTEPDNVSVRKLMSQAYLNRGDAGKALVELRKIRQLDLHQISFLIGEYGKLLQLDPKNVTARYDLANLHADRRDVANAVIEYRTILKMDMSYFNKIVNRLRNLAEITDKKFEMHLLLADLYVGEGMWSEGLAEQKAALGLQPGNASLRQQIRKTYHYILSHLGTRTEEAIRLAEEYSSFENHSAESLKVLEGLYLKKLSIVPGDLETRYRLGEVHMYKGQFADAMQTLAPVAGNIEYKEKAWYRIGICQAKLKNIMGAIQAFQNAIANEVMSRENTEIFYNLGVAYEMVGDMARAKVIYERIFKNQPDYRDIMARMKNLGFDTPQGRF